MANAPRSQFLRFGLDSEERIDFPGNEEIPCPNRGVFDPTNVLRGIKPDIVSLSMVFDATRPGFWSRFPMVYDLFASPILTMAFLVSAAAMKVLASVGLNLRA